VSASPPDWLVADHPFNSGASITLPYNNYQGNQMFCIVIDDERIIREGLRNLDEADRLCQSLEASLNTENLMVMRTDRAEKMGMRRGA
jgi:hypothetical protein